jgi:glucosylceramidase
VKAGVVEIQFDNVGKVHEMYPDKNLFFTEGCDDSVAALKRGALWKIHDP